MAVITSLGCSGIIQVNPFGTMPVHCKGFKRLIVIVLLLLLCC